MALPKLAYLGKFFKVKSPYTTGYPTILTKLWELLDRDKYLWVTLDSEHIRLHDAEKLKQFESQFEGDFMILKCDLGEKYKGKSPASVREMSRDELLFSSFHALSVLLQDPTQLTSYEQTFWDCPADDYDWSADGDWAHCPGFYRSDGRLRFDAGCSGVAGGDFGSAVSFGSVLSPLGPLPLLGSLASRITAVEIDGIRFIPEVKK